MSYQIKNGKLFNNGIEEHIDTNNVAQCNYIKSVQRKIDSFTNKGHNVDIVYIGSLSFSCICDNNVSIESGECDDQSEADYDLQNSKITCKSCKREYKLVIDNGSSSIYLKDGDI